MKTKYKGLVCADCKHHICSNICTSVQDCNGRCSKHRTTVRCFKSANRCKDLEKWFNMEED